jgi:glycosyltransferase involved in cell wall biosynthesis
MTASPRASATGALDASWRARQLSLQEQSLPDGRVAVSCPAPRGVGGLGRHLEEIVLALQRRGDGPASVLDADAEHLAVAARRTLSLPGALARVAPLARFSPAWRMWMDSVRFDLAAASVLPQADHLIAFNGTASAQFRKARRAGMPSMSLMSANSHMRKVVRQHERAYRQYPIERPWGAHILARNLREYARADRIHVASRYVWESFSEEGFADERLSLFPLTPDPRYAPSREPRAAETFDVVYVGSLVVHKGVPLLIEAFRRLVHADLRLILVGGWKTPSMRRFIQRACAEDGRITVSPGDPLEHLRSAGLCVHAAYEDGFAYAPAEALACGVPVIVSEDTGMKDLIAAGANGLVLPTGDPQALAEAIEAGYRRELLA